MKVAAYVRVSTKKQDEAIQRKAIEDWLATRSGEIESTAWFIDHGRSGAKMDRPALEHMQRAIFRREVDTIVMYALDRFARAMVDGLNELQRWEEERLRMIFIKDSLELDPNNPIGRVCMRLMAAVVLALAEAERERTLQRTRDGQLKALEVQREVCNMATAGMPASKIAKNRGLTLDRVKKMIQAGAKNTAFWQIQPSRTKKKGNTKRAFELREQGLSYPEIGRTLGINKNTARDYCNYEKKRRAGRCSENQQRNSSGDSAPNAGKS